METTPIINIIRVSSDFVQQVYQDNLSFFRLKREHSISLVQMHKNVFGKQTKTWIGGSESRRFYIWEQNNWRIYVHNAQGVTFEVPEGVTTNQAMEAWNEYKDKMIGNM